jgi:acetyltransferase-like isoleucine patch superfamily enzyme
MMRLRKVTFSEFPKIYGIVIWKCSGKIRLGKNVRITSSFNGNPVGGQSKTCFLITREGKISIGNNVAISNSTIVSMNEIEIKDDVMIGGGVQIFDTDFHSINYDNRLMSPDPDIKTARVVINKGAFIGARAIILKGVTIGEKSVVAAGAIVTKNIPPFQIWGGNPAKFIKNLNN